ncbi:MAG TPA: transglycosylase SLT domain-containing protein [Anaerolineaceae bacterium]|nr:transglycosylase SLT domain-containing protein [Anaerolineaceae bacterium]
MSLGPRLVIPGVTLGCLLLGAFLFFLTSGLSYPEVVQAAEPAPQATPENSIQVDSAEGTDPLTVETDFTGPEGDCQLSAQFPDSVLQWCDLIQHYASKRGLSPNLVAALILQESSGNSQAYSHSGAVGLMQVMPRDGLAASFMCRSGPCFTNRPSINELQDPEFNISYGTKMLANLAQKYGDIREALKAYGPMDVGYYYSDIVLGLYQQYAGSEN